MLAIVYRIVGGAFSQTTLGQRPEEVREQAFQGSANAKNLRQERAFHI